jgi:EpsI family protein
MMDRRNLLIGGACVAAAGTAYALKPRQHLVLLKGGKMADAFPLSFGDWTAEDSDGLVQPTSDGSLAATLYSEMVGRLYHQASTGASVMMLVAYGDRQSDLLQLHRPEACYPAVGFNLLSVKSNQLELPGSGVVPIREIVARAPGRQENIVYWTRIGEYLPNTSSMQRSVRLRIAMQGYIPDGALFRFSMLGEDSAAAFKTLHAFIPKLLAAAPQKKRPALIGTQLAATMMV